VYNPTVEGFFFPLSLTIRQRDDGSFIATAKQVPIMIVAKDRARLAEKMNTLQAKFDALLAGMSEADREVFLRERGLMPLGPQDTEPVEFSMPVFVGA
jgi:hypothetical protein